MNAVIVTGASAKEIASLVPPVQGKQRITFERNQKESEREHLIRVYERRLEKLKAGASPGDVIF